MQSAGAQEMRCQRNPVPPSLPQNLHHYPTSSEEAVEEEGEADKLGSQGSPGKADEILGVLTTRPYPQRG